MYFNGYDYCFEYIKWEDSMVYFVISGVGFKLF